MTAPRSRILVVDDNLTNLKLVTFLLSQRPYDVRAAVDADDALELIRSFKPRLVLIDLQLADVDGLALARRLRSDPASRDTLIVAVSTQAMMEEEKARALGVDGYISKPLEPDRFRRAVESYLVG